MIRQKVQPTYRKYLTHTMPSSIPPTSPSPRTPSPNRNTALPFPVVPSGNKQHGRLSDRLAALSVLYIPLGATSKVGGKDPVRVSSASSDIF